MKKFGILSVCLLALLVVIYAITSTGSKNAYDNEENSSTEEQQMTQPETDSNQQPVPDEQSEPIAEDESQQAEPMHASTADQRADKTIRKPPVSPERIEYSFGFYYEPLSEEIKEKKEALIKASQSIAVKAYEKVQKQQQSQESQNNDNAEENVVDADYEDIK